MKLLAALAKKKALILDGAMGSQLLARGISPSATTNIEHPEVVATIHESYRLIGCDILLTNSLMLNPLYLAGHGIEVDWAGANRVAVQLARQAAGSSSLVLGDIGPTGQLLAPYGALSEEQAIAAYRQQAEVLAEAGVDGFILETFYDLTEACCALRACQEVSALPVIVSFAFSTAANGGRTVMGQSAQEIARTAVRLGAVAVGANCGELTPQEMAAVVETMAAVVDLPIIAQPNAGKPQQDRDRLLYTMQPEEFAYGLLECLRAGASLVGGCCGTGPDHLRAVMNIIQEKKTRLHESGPVSER